jgi:hypothetical protein
MAGSRHCQATPTLSLNACRGQALPDELTDLGYRGTPIGEGQRMLAHAITERFLTEGSTVVQVRQHAGIVAAARYEVLP